MVRKSSDTVFDKLHKVVKQRHEEGHFGKRPKKIEKKVPKHILKKQLKKEKTWWEKYKKEAAIKELKGISKELHKPEAAKKQPARGEVFNTLKIRDIAVGRTEKKTAFLDFFTRAKSKEVKKKVESKIIYDFFRKSKKKEPPKILSLIKTRPTEEPKFKIPIAPGELTKKILVDTIMSRNPISVDISAPIEEVLNLILKYNIRGVPVTQNGKVVGIIEEDDIINYFEKRIPMSEGAIRLRHKEIDELSERPISDLHPKRLVILSPNDSLEKAIKALYETDIGRICVMEEDKLVGLVTRDDVVKALMKSTISMHIITSEVMHTDIDRLLELIEEKGRVTIDEASEKLKVDRQMIEEWAAILEEHSLITVEYPIIGTVELVKKEE
jgi:CBS domain-containing protein